MSLAQLRNELDDIIDKAAATLDEEDFIDFLTESINTLERTRNDVEADGEEEDDE